MMQSEEKLCSSEGNMAGEEENDGKTKIGSELPRIHFTVDTTCIPTVLQCEQETELSGLDVKIYQQDVLEKEILDQVDKAFENHLREKNEESSLQRERVEEKNRSNGEKVEEKKEQLQCPNVVSCEESEKEKKIRLGEMTPFGTEISLKTIEGNNLENIEQYLKKQVKISNEKRGAKRKMSQTKTAKKKIRFTKDKDKCLSTVQNVFHEKRKKSGEESQIKNDSNKLKSDHDNTSGSEYVPSPSDGDSNDPDFELESKFLKCKKRKKRKDADSNDDEIDQNDSECEGPRKAISRGEKDDGDESNYLMRMEKWEKENSREDIETQVQVLGDGFKVPSIVWNKLYNYQRVGVQWLLELNLQRCGGIVGDEMGLGKTIQIIAFLSGLNISKLISPHGFFRGLGPVLIVCPTTVMHYWVKEFHRWWPQFRVALLHESGTYKGNKKDLIRDIVKCNGILITSYVTCIQQSNHLLRYTWHYVILDEGHKIRNPDSQITVTVKMFKTPHRLILSGSPIQNNLKELWSLFDFIFPGKLGTLPVFLAEFGVPITQGGYANASKVQVATAYKCATVLRDIISPYLLRRVKEDVKTHINLPPKNEQVLFCKLTREQKDMYLDYLNSGKVTEILNGKQKVFVGLIELRKICNHPHLYSGGPKISKWDNLVPEEEKYGHWKKAGKMIVLETLLKMWKKQGHRVLIFTQSRKMLAILENFISSQNHEYLKMDGTTTIGSRQPLINKFNENKKYYIFLSTTHVGGLGINLTGANRVVIYDPDWNPATDMQARERAWRIGQENQVTIYRFVTAGTIEEKIYHRQIFKQFLTIKVLKDPRQRRFFKSNDLYELFTFKDDEKTNETSAIFAGTGFELNGENLPRRKKRVGKLKQVFSCEPESIRDVTESRNMLTKEKIEKMKRMAQALSRKIGMEVLREGTQGVPSKGGEAGDGPATVYENRNVYAERARKKATKSMDEINGLKKRKKHKRGHKTLRGEFVPHLEKERKYRDVIKEASNHERGEDYILKKLFSKSGVQSALKHDEIMESGPADYVLIEGEAEKIAREAVKALKESRKNYTRNLSESQSSANTLSKPRFGRKSFHQQSSANLVTCNDSNKDKFMSSAELLLRIRQRNGLSTTNKPGSSLSDNSELLTDIRNFISFGAEKENEATTQEIVDKFRDRLPAGQTPLFKALLSEICEFHRTIRGEGIWQLRSDFRCVCLRVRFKMAADRKKNSEQRRLKTSSYESQTRECESVKLLCGPPFDQRDYMISPSESESDSCWEKTVAEKKKNKCGPGDIKIDKKYILDSRGALKKLLELIRNGCVRPFAGRIKDLIFKYLHGCPCGFHVDELPSIVEIVEYFSRNKSENPQFAGFVDILMRGSRNPPIVGKSSDLLRSKRILADYFTVFGELLATFEDFDFQIRLLQSLECLITRRNLSEVAAVKLSICHEALGESQLPYAIAALMETVPFNLYFYYLDISIQIIMASLKAGQLMLESNILNFVLWRLNFCEEKSLSNEIPNNAEEEALLNDYYTLLEKSSYLIWGLLTIVSREDENVPAPGECALRSLKIVFERECRKKCCKGLNARNNLAGFIVKLCAVFGKRLPLNESGLVVDIAIMAIATEMGTQGTWVEECCLGTKKEDYILKKIMLLSCSLMASNKKSIESLKSLKVIEGILCLINPRSKSYWIPSQYIDLFYVGLRTLSELVPQLPEVFVLNRGNARLVSAMKWFMEQYFDRGSLLEILRTFYVIVTCENNKCIIEDILVQDFVGFILELCSYLINNESIKSEDQEKLTRIFIILERLFRNERNFLNKYSETCSAVAVSLLKRILKDSDRDSKWNSHLLVSFGGFIWESIAWSSSSLASFIEKNGIYYLLDIVELSSFPVQMLFLGILVEMTDGGKSILHLSTWRGKSGFGILDLMIRIWRDEEKITKVHRTENGFIQDIEMPLMTEEQWYLTHQMRGSHNYSPSVAEMNCSARPKIHALYQFLRERYCELTKISESSYTIYLERVRSSYQVYIPLIEHFLSLKMGEIWFEVLRDATISGVIPTAYDGDVMCTLIDEKNKWAARIKTMQEEIALNQKKEGSEDEKQFYNLLKSCQLTSSLEALSELDYVARTSVQKFQNQRKEKQVQDVEKSLEALSFPPEINIHRTFLSKINATCFCANYVRIKSEKEVAEYETISIVSSESSECNRFSNEEESNAI